MIFFKTFVRLCKNYLTATIQADKIEIPYFTIKTKEISTSSIQIASALNAGVHGDFKIGPEINLMLFNIVGPYVSVPVKMKVDLKMNASSNWSGETSIGLNGIIGAKAEIKKTIFYDKYNIDYHKELIGDKLTYKYNLPKNLILLSGDGQNGLAGKELPKPITFEVKSSFGIGFPFIPVRFLLENGNGTVQSSFLYTDMFGRVSVNWTLGSNTECKLKAYVLDYENVDIDGSPIYVTAYSSGGATTCENSNLALTINATSTYKYPVASGGTAPYTYSKNGIDFSSVAPQFSLTTYGSFTVYVKDKNQCTRVKTFTVSAPNVCNNSDLTIDIITVSNSLTVNGKKGTAPYVYAIDTQSNYTSNNFYSNLSAGYHTVFVKDANGCIVSSDVKIDANTAASIRASYPAQGASSIALSPNTFQWAAATYTTNQLYDLYLKKGTDAYTLIASNLSTTSFTYNTALLASTAYTWKVAVKGGGTVIDFSEFNFTTASGISTTPTVPVLLQPANGASVYATATFKWTPQAGDFKYDLYLDTNNATTLVAMNLTAAECTVSKLVSGNTYYWKLKIKSTITGATATSAMWSFTVLNSGNTVTDIDGNVYHTVTIGTQTWMVENLNSTKYRNGEPLLSDEWCNYLNDASYGMKYGKLYKWSAVTNIRNLAPLGWHIASDDEWSTLGNYIISNGLNFKEGSGFNMLSGGYKLWDGSFLDIETRGYWWSPIIKGSSYIWNSLYLYSNSSTLSRFSNPNDYSFSVRCVKDDSTNPLNIPTALIPAGTFTMGSPTTEVRRYSDETQHTVTLSAFRMSKYEITNSQYAAFLNAKGIGSNGIWAAAPLYKTQTLIYASSGSYDWSLHYTNNKWVPVTGYETSPVIDVTWYGATEYASYVGGTLPTEAQWEYACRAGTTTPFNTGNFLTNLQANYNWAYPYNGGTNTATTYPGKTQPVGTYAPNAYGLYDMHGNVWEWCADWYGTYPATAQTNPTGAATGSYRVNRGGSWYAYAQDCRSADRSGGRPDDDGGTGGFRVVFVP